MHLTCVPPAVSPIATYESMLHQRVHVSLHLLYRLVFVDGAAREVSSSAWCKEQAIRTTRCLQPVEADVQEVKT